jgi:hypothetical protein
MVSCCLLIAGSSKAILSEQYTDNRIPDIELLPENTPSKYALMYGSCRPSTKVFDDLQQLFYPVVVLHLVVV